MECAMEIVETPEYGPVNNPEPVSEVQSESHEKSSAVEAPSHEESPAVEAPSLEESPAVEAPSKEKTSTVEATCNEKLVAVEVAPHIEETSSQTEKPHGIDPTPETKSSSSQIAASSETVPTSKASSSLPGSTNEATSSSKPSAKLMNGPAVKKEVDYDAMSTGVYLDATVVPILHVALVNLDRLRPADPVQFVIDFLLRNKAQYSSKSKEQPVTSTSANHA